MAVGRKTQAANAGWKFVEVVANTFIDHIKLSVPLYEKGHDLICQGSDFFVPDVSVVGDIGTSGGGLLRRTVAKQARGAVVDPAMVKAARDIAGAWTPSNEAYGR